MKDHPALFAVPMNDKDATVDLTEFEKAAGYDAVRKKQRPNSRDTVTIENIHAVKVNSNSMSDPPVKWAVYELDGGE